MCGIFGYTGERIDAANLVFSGLKTLEYRGYDSWGIAVGTDDGVQTVRDVGKLVAAPGGMPHSGLALGHTRWATTGAVTQANAHPHRDCTGRFALVHNGIIENYALLREGLKERGHRFQSETDSEVVAHMLEEEYDTVGQLPVDVESRLAEALRRVSHKLDGLNALAALDVRTGELAAVKNGSPLVVGIGDGATYLASDQAALLAHTDKIVFVRDGQAVALWPDHASLIDSLTGTSIPLEVEQVRWRPEQAQLNGYNHFLEKEIWEQPKLLREIASGGMEQAIGLASFLAESRGIYFVGCGTAYHAALIGSYLMSTQARRLTTVSYPHEFARYAPLVKGYDAVLAFSQSGETIDVLDAVREARARGAAIGAMTNVPGSTLTREASFKLMLGAGPERSVLSTKTFTAKVAYMMLAAGVIAGEPEAAKATLLEAASDIEALKDGTDGRLDAIRRVAHCVAPHDHMFLLGRGLGHAMSLEAALKIKEVSYIHAEGFAAGELKHGVIALVEPGTPVLVLAPDGADEAHMLTAAGEVKARGAQVIGIGPRNHPVFDFHVPVTAEGDAFYLAATAVTQRLAYELALLRGTDPDKPRNLAKSVTVR
ncbi:MAG TPA: glutamine--fructose-6-phosphate transaminase (isomerizing) [Chloroflexia bacterium]|nr:glutamine--fructose-6-phosphate transaminase (isomerizing) [Chloroflexia bacterium]